MSKAELVIVEGVEGYYRYHWAPDDRKARALCGARTMSSGVPVWGMRCGNESIRYKWCEKCAGMKGESKS